MVRKLLSLPSVIVILLLTANAGVIYFLTRSVTKPVVSDRLYRIWHMKTFDGRTIPGQLKLPWVVEVIDADNEKATSEVTQVLNLHLLHPIIWVILTPEPSKLIKKAGLPPRVAYIVSVRPPAATALLGRKEVGDLWSVFDSNHTVRAEGSFVHGGLLGELGSLVDGNPPFSPQLIQSRLMALDQKGLFAAVHEKAKEAPSKKALVLFVDSAATGCGIDTVIGEFVAASANNPLTSHIIIVPGNWESAEIRNLRTNLEIRTQISKATPQLTETWSDLSLRFGQLRLNGFLALFTPNRIADVTVDSSQVHRALSAKSDAD